VVDVTTLLDVDELNVDTLTDEVLLDINVGKI